MFNAPNKKELFHVVVFAVKEAAETVPIPSEARAVVAAGNAADDAGSPTWASAQASESGATTQVVAGLSPELRRTAAKESLHVWVMSADLEDLEEADFDPDQEMSEADYNKYVHYKVRAMNSLDDLPRLRYEDFSPDVAVKPR